MSSARLYQLNHCNYYCHYHLVWTPKYRGKVLVGTFIKSELKRMFNMIAKWKGFTLYQWHIGDEHIHLYLSIPPKYSVAYTVEILKSKTSAWLKKKTKKFPKGPLWCRGYFVSTIGITEIALRKYIENQWKHQIDLQKLPLKV